MKIQRNKDYQLTCPRLATTDTPWVGTDGANDTDDGICPGIPPGIIPGGIPRGMGMPGINGGIPGGMPAGIPPGGIIPGMGPINVMGGGGGKPPGIMRPPGGPIMGPMGGPIIGIIPASKNRNISMIHQQLQSWPSSWQRSGKSTTMAVLWTDHREKEYCQVYNIYSI